MRRSYSFESNGDGDDDSHYRRDPASFNVESDHSGPIYDGYMPHSNMLFSSHSWLSRNVLDEIRPPRLELGDLNDSESLLTSMAAYIQSPTTTTTTDASEDNPENYPVINSDSSEQSALASDRFVRVNPSINNSSNSYWRRQSGHRLEVTMSSSTPSTSTSTSPPQPPSSLSNYSANTLWPGLLSPDASIHRNPQAREQTLAGGSGIEYNSPISMASAGLTSLVAPDTKIRKTTAPSFVPDYLLDTGYAALVATKQQQQQQQQQKSSPSSQLSFGASFGGSIGRGIPGHFDTSSNTGRTLPSLSSSLNDSNNSNNRRDSLRPPTIWNSNDRCPLLDVSRDGLSVTYIGSGKSDNDAAALRANRPMPVQAGIYYFEVEIISKGRDGYIGIGFSSSSVSLKRLPGWELDSWGYHGDDGHKFCCSGTGQKYGPTFSTGDIIGCCVNFASKTSFFTKNGMNLVGMRTPQERILVNFGDRPFRFDIHQYIREEKARLWQAINTAPLPALSASSAKLVLDHLLHHGYHDAAQPKSSTSDKSDDMQIASTSMITDTKDNSIDEVELRKDIYEAVMRGNISYAKELIDQHYPEVFKRNGMLLFQLKCQEFVELMRLCTPPPPTSNDKAQPMDLDQDGSSNHTELSRSSQASKKRPATGEESVEIENQLLDPAMQEAMIYGQKLQEDYQFDQRPSVRDALVNIFSLFAYPDPSNSVVAYLLDTGRRQPIADALNSAIIVSLGRSPNSSLERVYRQTATTVNALTQHGIAGAGLINLKYDGQAM
ncbi:hypothetical protein BDF19DRAFT_425629 [Syncephalis fuscata]|nr:hypothetical protein BDF19DRAFT_425629 [Syncephalis fuscata]